METNNKQPNGPQVVHVARNPTPEVIEISPEIQLKHKRSQEMYPEINLTAGEYVISSIKRHPIGLFPSIFVGLLLATIGFSALFNTGYLMQLLSSYYPNVSESFIAVPSLVAIVLALVGVYISYYVFSNNRFYLTNESVIQIIQTSLFARQEQIVSLANIEDCSYKKTNFIEQLLDFGEIRLSTEGEETTYSFSIAPRPKYYTEILNNAVEAFKNGRAITESDVQEDD